MEEPGYYHPSALPASRLERRRSRRSRSKSLERRNKMKPKFKLFGRKNQGSEDFDQAPDIVEYSLSRYQKNVAEEDKLLKKLQKKQRKKQQPYKSHQRRDDDDELLFSYAMADEIRSDAHNNTNNDEPTEDNNETDNVEEEQSFLNPLSWMYALTATNEEANVDERDPNSRLPVTTVEDDDNRQEITGNGEEGYQADQELEQHPEEGNNNETNVNDKIMPKKSRWRRQPRKKIFSKKQQIAEEKPIEDTLPENASIVKEIPTKTKKQTNKKKKKSPKKTMEGTIVGAPPTDQEQSILAEAPVEKEQSTVIAPPIKKVQSIVGAPPMKKERSILGATPVKKERTFNGLKFRRNTTVKKIVEENEEQPVQPEPETLPIIFDPPTQWSFAESPPPMMVPMPAIEVPAPAGLPSPSPPVHRRSKLRRKMKSSSKQNPSESNSSLRASKSWDRAKKVTTFPIKLARSASKSTRMAASRSSKAVAQPFQKTSGTSKALAFSIRRLIESNQRKAATGLLVSVQSMLHQSPSEYNSPGHLLDSVQTLIKDTEDKVSQNQNTARRGLRIGYKASKPVENTTTDVPDTPPEVTEEQQPPPVAAEEELARKPSVVSQLIRSRSKRQQQREEDPEEDDDLQKVHLEVIKDNEVISSDLELTRSMSDDGTEVCSVFDVYRSDYEDEYLNYSDEASEGLSRYSAATSAYTTDFRSADESTIGGESEFETGENTSYCSEYESGDIASEQSYSEDEASRDVEFADADDVPDYGLVDDDEDDLSDVSCLLSERDQRILAQIEANLDLLEDQHENEEKGWLYRTFSPED